MIMVCQIKYFLKPVEPTPPIESAIRGKIVHFLLLSPLTNPRKCVIIWVWRKGNETSMALLSRLSVCVVLGAY